MGCSAKKNLPSGLVFRADLSDRMSCNDTVVGRPGKRIGTEAQTCGRPGKESNMLVLSRQRDETIMIGDDVEITIVDIRGDKVRLGISAPPHVAVHRKEVYEAIRREKQANGVTGAVDSLANRKEKPKTEPQKTSQ